MTIILIVAIVAAVALWPIIYTEGVIHGRKEARIGHVKLSTGEQIIFDAGDGLTLHMYVQQIVYAHDKIQIELGNNLYD